jgi:hypothetical protein
MSNLNGKGPANEGPGTGRRRGRCNPAITEKVLNEDRNEKNIFGLGRGGRPRGGRGNQQGRGYGKGNGRRRGFGSTQNSAME